MDEYCCGSHTHFDLLMEVNQTNGMSTPLLGVWLLVYSSIAKISLKDHMRDLLPMPGVLIVVLPFATYIPGLALWLPGLFDYVDSSYRSGD